jgi:spore coat polysaccharide biosynthesis protein SpsF
MKVVAIIQARMNSTRLPGKVMQQIADRTVLGHVVARVRLAKEIDEIIIATTTMEIDHTIVEEVNRLGCKVSRGSEEDVLSRYYHAALDVGADVVVRITSDCPLIDPNVIDAMLQWYKSNKYVVVSNAGAVLSNRTYPRGLDTEIFSFEILKEAFEHAEEPYQREHVTPYLYEKYSNVYYYKNNEDYSFHRWTLDTIEDLELITRIYQYLYKGNHDFFLKEIIQVFSEHPDLITINGNVEQKTLNQSE